VVLLRLRARLQPPMGKSTPPGHIFIAIAKVVSSQPSAGLSGNVHTFTAYDHQGNGYTRERVPSETSSKASDATVFPARNNKWAKPAGRRVEPKMTMPVVLPPARFYESDSEDGL
jgi:hypothetical protein